MRFLFSFLLIIISLILNAQNPDAAALKKQMAQIRQTTNWSNAEEAKKANEQIRKLSKQLMMINSQSNQSNQTQIPEGEDQKMSEENAEFRMQLWEQIWVSARGGETADVDLAKPLREKIVKAYEEDESQVVKNQDFLNEMNLLVIDMSMPGVQAVIDQMENYQAVKYLIITGGAQGCPVNLDDIMNRASAYPLQSLYIINFKNFVSEIPTSIGSFSNLNVVGLFNNSIVKIPSLLASLNDLEILLLDKNPVATLLPVIQSCHKLKTLGIAQTGLTDEEKEKLKLLLPECNILQ